MLRRKHINLFRDPRLDELDNEMAQEALPGVASGRAIRRSNLALGREKRDALSSITRLSGGDPQLITEGITDLNRNVGQTAADNVLGAEDLETRRRAGIAGQRQNFLLSREQLENEERIANSEIDAENDDNTWNFFTDILGVGSNIAGFGLQRRILQRLAQGGIRRRDRY